MKELIFKFLQLIVPPIVFDSCFINFERMRLGIKEKYPSAYVRPGKHLKMKYCVVRYVRPNVDITAAGLNYIFIYYALKKRGYIPVLDLELAYSYSQGRIGEENMWDICFDQAIQVKDIQKDFHVIISGEYFPIQYDKEICNDINGKIDDCFIHVRRENYKNYYATVNKYLKPVWKIKEFIYKDLQREIGASLKNRKVLGVSLREAFSDEVPKGDVEIVQSIYDNHPLLPTTYEVIEIIKNNLNDWSYDIIFLSTEFEESIDLFRKEFGNKVIFIRRKRKRYSDYQKIVSIFQFDDESIYLDHQQKKDTSDNYQEVTIPYIKEIVALSQCDYLIGGSSGGTAAALSLNGGVYEDIYILEDKRNISRY